MKSLMKEKIEYIEAGLKKFTEKNENPQNTIYEACRYSLDAGGKRLRPMLLIECYKMCGGDNEDLVLPFACAMEMIHTYSLIHDDLPAMDNDDLRRGKATNHKVYGEAMAILAGDALLNLAFETAISAKGILSDRKIKAIEIMSESSGWDGMIGGQVVDIESEGKKITLDELRYIHKLKTGALIKAACMMGAVLAGVDDKTLGLIEKYAENLGIAFQIQDDILDVTANEEELGKPVGSDEKNEKSTYVTLCGLEKAKEYVKEYTDKALECIEGFGKKAEFLVKLTEFLLNRKF